MTENTDSETQTSKLSLLWSLCKVVFWLCVGIVGLLAVVALVGIVSSAGYVFLYDTFGYDTVHHYWEIGAGAVLAAILLGGLLTGGAREAAAYTVSRGRSVASTVKWYIWNGL